MVIDKTSKRVGEMFDSIAPTYDVLNRLLSFKRDTFWRKEAVNYALDGNPSVILDIATGTGDMLVEIRKKTNAQLHAIDISENMLNIARQKLAFDNNIEFYLMQAEYLDFQNDFFDAVTVAFGVRNFENIDLAFKEIYRVLKNNGRLVVLEFIRPDNKVLYSFLKIYIKYVLPKVGQLISKNKKAYRYLYETIEDFYTKNAFIDMCKKYNFYPIASKTYNGGLVAIFVLKK